ncbi:hypothetical protein Y032_0011g1365 [Ancylostoma ceylanicum]|uniref:Uncharacterized protein n=1 Tax=Ancylostoma ceylanicum TaxID=53326 RepID=A0A016VDL5_9BILA|nr:hypothetical protein Y032_0011g1365 [Ancylostoma ceylanicum]
MRNIHFFLCVFQQTRHQPLATLRYVSSWGKKGCGQATLIGAVGPPVTPTCSTRTALSTNGPCYRIGAVRVETDERDGRPDCANQSRLITPPFLSR